MARARRPVFSAAMIVVPEPLNGSSTMPLRFGHVLDGIGHQRHRLYGRVHRQLLVATSPERVHPGVVPHVGAVPPMLAKLKVVGVRRGTVLPDVNQLMFGAIK